MPAEYRASKESTSVPIRSPCFPHTYLNTSGFTAAHSLEQILQGKLRMRNLARLQLPILRPTIAARRMTSVEKLSGNCFIVHTFTFKLATMSPAFVSVVH